MRMAFLTSFLSKTRTDGKSQLRIMKKATGTPKKRKADTEDEEDDADSVHIDTRRAFLNPPSTKQRRTVTKSKKTTKRGEEGEEEDEDWKFYMNDGTGEDKTGICPTCKRKLDSGKCTCKPSVYRITEEDKANAEAAGATLIDFFGELNPEDLPTETDLERERASKRSKRESQPKRRRLGKRLGKRTKAGDSDIVFGEDIDEDDGDDWSSIDSIPAQPPREAEIASRMDPIAQCLTLACGFCRLSLGECFHTNPPETCFSYLSYKPYMTPGTRTALANTHCLILRITKKKKSLMSCLMTDPDGPVFFAVAQMTGEFMRKTHSDNPIKMVPTKPGMFFLDRELNRALLALIRELREPDQTSSVSTIQYADPGMRFVLPNATV